MKGKGDHDLLVHRSSRAATKDGETANKIEQGGLEEARADYACNLCTVVGAMQRCARIT